MTNSKLTKSLRNAAGALTLTAILAGCGQSTPGSNIKEIAHADDVNVYQRGAFDGAHVTILESNQHSNTQDPVRRNGKVPTGVYKNGQLVSRGGSAPKRSGQYDFTAYNQMAQAEVAREKTIYDAFGFEGPEGLDEAYSGIMHTLGRYQAIGFASELNLLERESRANFAIVRHSIAAGARAGEGIADYHEDKNPELSDLFRDIRRTANSRDVTKIGDALADDAVVDRALAEVPAQFTSYQQMVDVLSGMHRDIKLDGALVQGTDVMDKLSEESIVQLAYIATMEKTLAAKQPLPTIGKPVTVSGSIKASNNNRFNPGRN